MISLKSIAYVALGSCLGAMWKGNEHVAGVLLTIAAILIVGHRIVLAIEGKS